MNHELETVNPTTEANWNNENFRSAGICLRDYIASKAISGICAHTDTWGYNVEEIAKASYELADAMLKARKL